MPLICLSARREHLELLFKQIKTIKCTTKYNSESCFDDEDNVQFVDDAREKSTHNRSSEDRTIINARGLEFLITIHCSF